MLDHTFSSFRPLSDPTGHSTWVVAETAERGAADSDGGHDGSGLCVEDDQMTLGGTGRQRHAERVEAEGHALVRDLGRHRHVIQSEVSGYYEYAGVYQNLNMALRL